MSAAGLLDRAARMERPDPLLAAIAGHVAALAMRRAHFPNVPFRGVAWAILLDVAAAERRGRPLRWIAAATADKTAPSTGGKHLHALIRRGLIARGADGDRRAALVRLTDAGWAGLIGWLHATATVGADGPRRRQLIDRRRRDRTIDAAAAQLTAVRRQLEGLG